MRHRTELLVPARVFGLFRTDSSIPGVYIMPNNSTKGAHSKGCLPAYAARSIAIPRAILGDTVAVAVTCTVRDEVVLDERICLPAACVRFFSACDAEEAYRITSELEGRNRSLSAGCF